MCLNATFCTECVLVTFIPQGDRCVPICGDGAIIRPSEQCDDGNTMNGDGCSSMCQVEANFQCVGEPSACVSTLPPVTNNCGNGRLDTG